jgi:hypothetical protein
MANKIWSKFVNSRETLPVALSQQFSTYKMVYNESKFSSDSVNIVITSIEDDIILAIYFAGHTPKEKNAKIIIHDEKGIKVGLLYVIQQEAITIGNEQVYLYKVISSRNQLPYLYSILMNHIVYAAKRKFKYNTLEGKRLHHLFVYYIKPRPAFLLSLKDGDDFDIFPVDLNGNIFNDYYMQSIKSTNKAVNAIKEAAAFCLSAVPFSKADVIYKLHEQRKKEKMGLKNLPFSVLESRELKIPVPDFAISVREFRVERAFENGLYTTFVMKSINHYTLSEELQFAHAPWYRVRNIV